MNVRIPRHRESQEKRYQNMRNYRMITSDLDGTLLKNDMTVSRENEHAIKALTAKNTCFVPCSGRAFSEIPTEVRDNPHVRYLIHSDGAVIYDKIENKRITACMTPEISARVMDILSDYEVCSTVHYLGNAYIDAAKKNAASYAYHRVNDYFRKLIDETAAPRVSFDDFCRSMEEIELFCVFFRDDGELTECKRRLEEIEEIQVVSSDAANLEIISKEAGKGNALLRLAKELGVDPARTIAVGDSPNDLSMLQTAGLGLAVKNACDAAKNIADGVICSNEDHIARYILNHYID